MQEGGMRIDLTPSSSNELERESNAPATAHVRSGEPKTGPEAAKDAIAVSMQGFSVPALETRVAGMTDVRDDKVAALRQAIQNGNYDIAPDEIAEAILKESGE
jgi:flagellar biosynthesis anti-sigma factor FlgM